MQNLLRRYANGENAQQDKTDNTSYRPGKVQNMLLGCKLWILRGYAVKAMGIFAIGF